jgi:pimeloyl-ACP methyl ester carboxylesterase
VAAKEHRMKRYLKILLAALLVVAIVLFIFTEFAIKNILPYSSIRPSRCTQNYANPSNAGLAWKNFDITVEDTIKLRGWFVMSESHPVQGTIFLLHGIGSCKASMLPMAKFLTSNGFNCVLYDSRANGESGGIDCTFGYFEKRDLSHYIDSALVRFPSSNPYAVFGSSLGAAVAVQALANEKRLVCGIAESPFANLRDIIRDYFADIIHFHLDIIPDEALKNTEQIAHFCVDSVRPAFSAFQINQPTMIIHGNQDQKISVLYGKQVFENIHSLQKEWYPISGGNHNNLRNIGGAEYEQRIITFFKKHLIAATSPGAPTHLPD